MHHIILGHHRDQHANHMLEKMREKGLDAYLLETNDFPCAVQLAYSPSREIGHLILADGAKLAFSEIKSVYWRNFCGVTDEANRGNFGTAEYISARDSMACLRSWFNVAENTLWANSWQAYEHHKEKPWQLLKAKKLGLNIPRTLVSNDINEIRRWYRANKKSVFKPVSGGSHTEMLSDDHLQGERVVKALSKSPITLQQYVEGTNIRTFVIGDDVFSAEFRSDSTDFRDDQNLEIILVDTPKYIAEQARSIMNSLHMTWTAIDWRRDVDGKYYFLEANPSPMFLGFEAISGFPVTDNLVSFLEKGKTHSQQ